MRFREKIKPAIYEFNVKNLCYNYFWKIHIKILSYFQKKKILNNHLRIMGVFKKYYFVENIENFKCLEERIK